MVYYLRPQQAGLVGQHGGQLLQSRPEELASLSVHRAPEERKRRRTRQQHHVVFRESEGGGGGGEADVRVGQSLFFTLSDVIDAFVVPGRHREDELKEQRAAACWSINNNII